MLKKLLSCALALTMIMSAATVFGANPSDPAQDLSSPLGAGLLPAFVQAAQQASGTSESEDLTATVSETPTKGKVEGQVYTNEFFGIRVELPDSWIYSTDEDLAQLMQKTQSTLNNDDINDMLDSGSIFYDMMASQLSEGKQILAQIQDFGEYAGLLNLSPRLYYEFVMQGENGEFLKQSMESVGVTNVELSIEDTDFMGEKIPSLVLSGTMYSVPLYERFIMFANGRYGMCLIATTYYTDDTQSVLSYASRIADTTASEENDDAVSIAFSSDWIQSKCQVAGIEDSWWLPDRINYYVKGEESDGYDFADFSFKSSDTSVLSIETIRDRELVVYHPARAGTVDVTMTYKEGTPDAISTTQTITVFDSPDAANGWEIEGEEKVEIPANGDYEWACDVSAPTGEKCSYYGLYVENTLGVGCTEWIFEEETLKGMSLHDFLGKGSGQIKLVLYRMKDDSNEVYPVAVKDIFATVK
ncbi:MAG: hypothetical protein Q4D81_11490 [Eubacteriales bacterium]|nr:hypothetical protein [Eubacteriales bacterium]